MAVREINICPVCKCLIKGYPAISRKDNKTEICSNCGMKEALADYLDNLKSKTETK